MDRRIVRLVSGWVEAAVARMHCNYQDPDRWPKRMSVRYFPIALRYTTAAHSRNFTVSAAGSCLGPAHARDISARLLSPTLSFAGEAMRGPDREHFEMRAATLVPKVLRAALHRCLTANQGAAIDEVIKKPRWT